MVSLWPWGDDPSSTASFEKTLSTLSAKISRAQSRLDNLRTRSRRIRGLATIYLVVAYLLYAIVALLVIGSQNMGPVEWTGLAGGPVVVYTTRYLIAIYYTYRIDTTTTRLQTQQEERAKTIQKLKDATKYNSTLELLEKYGGESKKDKKPAPGDEQQHHERMLQQQMHQQHQQQQQQQGRTNIPPPPTANIQVQQPPQRPVTPASSTLEPTAEFAPNAESSPGGGAPSFPSATGPVGATPNPQFHQYIPPSQLDAMAGGPKWYDRFLDLLLGEDEMAPRNRIALICENCRLVNGQAPPGTKTLQEVGKWKCLSCGSLNGEDVGQAEEEKILLRRLTEKEKNTAAAGKTEGPKGSEGDDSEDEAEDGVKVEA